MNTESLRILFFISTVGFVLASLTWSVNTQAANGQQCMTTSTLRGQFCQAPFGGFPNQAQCVATYNACINAMPRLIHNFCVLIDQPNCNRNDDCPKGSCCNVHPVNQQRWTDMQCFQDQNNRWRFEIFDVADCKCDCSEGAFPLPVEPDEPEGPDVITLACEDGSLDCSGCASPGDKESGDAGQCLSDPVPWGDTVEIEQQIETIQESRKN